ncbi:MAG: hypothetical protein JSV79_14245 [Armatimonadota bacterium]|nr:MAG: hypothetical protein JSV79_14245 [Armatimonadota bacterium]
MALRAGFAEVNITPPVGTRKIGWLKEIVIESVADPLFARAATAESGGEAIAFLQLDTLSIRWTQVNDIRRRVEEQYGFRGRNIMVAAAHNHAGPAVAHCGDVPCDDRYVEGMVARTVEMFGEALANMQDAEIGAASVMQWGLSHNRRVVMRDGTVRTHGRLDDPEALFIEGPIDPEVSVVAARAAGSGEMLGALVNFACHPTDHGDDSAASAGYPGVLAREMKERGCPFTLFLNGASGNIAASHPMEHMGRTLANDVEKALAAMSFSSEVSIEARSRTVQLPYREVTDDEVTGRVRGAQRFVDPAIYDREMPGLIARIKERGAQPAEVQALALGDRRFAGIPAEYFAENGLRIKEGGRPLHVLVVSCANGMVGYVPHKEAFLRGGYETTFAPGAALAPEAGDMLADAALALIGEVG